MPSSTQEKYREFAAQTPDLPLFMQPWYLDLVCSEGAWDAAVVEKNKQVVAVLPYFLKQKIGWRYVSMPPYCKQMGPFLAAPFRSPDWEMRLYEALIEQLPPMAAFEQNFNYSVNNWLPFYWKGFKQSTMYSYVLSLEPEASVIFNNIAKNYRQKIRAAEARLELRHDLPLAELHRLVGASFSRQQLEPPVSFDFLNALYEGLSAHHCVRLFFALDPAEGRTHSAAMLVWDQTTAYYLMSGDDPVLRASGAAVWLKWEAVRYSKNALQLPIFDFEGSMLKGVEQGRRDFGAVQRPYFRVRKEWSFWWKWGKFLRS